ncbi:MAG TPA: c-type cytochrome [Nitrospira sp.]
MTSGWRIGIALAVCMSGLLYGGIVLGQPESKVPPGDPARGKTLFVRNCAGCHGAAGGGDGYRLLGPDPANLTSPSISRKSDADLLKTIHDGKPNMPAWKGNLSEKQSRDVLAYVRTLKK